MFLNLPVFCIPSRVSLFLFFFFSLGETTRLVPLVDLLLRYFFLDYKVHITQTLGRCLQQEINIGPPI